LFQLNLYMYIQDAFSWHCYNGIILLRKKNVLRPHSLRGKNNTLGFFKAVYQKYWKMPHHLPPLAHERFAKIIIYTFKEQSQMTYIHLPITAPTHTCIILLYVTSLPLQQFISKSLVYVTVIVQYVWTTKRYIRK